MRCATHPNVDTSLTCSKCGKPICPKCLMETAVGFRCRDCARLQRLPTYRISIRHYLIATGTGFGVGVGAGILWGLIGVILPFFYLNLLLAAGVGYGISQVIGISVNRKRSTGLAIIAGCAVVLSYFVSVALPFGRLFPLFNILYLMLDLASIAIGVFVAVTRLR